MKIGTVVKGTLAVLLGAAMAQGIVGCSSSGRPGSAEWNSYIEPGEPALKRLSVGEELKLPTRPEIWVIEKVPGVGPRTLIDTEGLARPGSELRVISPAPERGDKLLPLQRMDVRAFISGYIACTDVTQRFENSMDQAVVASYMFRLPYGAAVNDFVMTIGERQIRAVIRERDEAEKIYREAVRQGYTASLVMQNAGGMLNQDIGPLEPGKTVDIKLRYFNALEYEDGGFAYMFPLSRMDTKNVSLDIQLDGLTPIDQIQSPTHAIDVERKSSQSAEVRLAENQAASDLDFVLRFRAVEKNKQAILLTDNTRDGNYFSLMLNPPAVDRPDEPIHLTLVLQAWDENSMERVREIAGEAINNLSPADTVRIIMVSDMVSSEARRVWGSGEASNLTSRDFLRGLKAGGFCSIKSGLDLAAAETHDPGRQQVVMVVTDGAALDASCFGIARRLGSMSRLVICRLAPGLNEGYAEALARCSGGVVANVSVNDVTKLGIKLLIQQSRAPAVSGIAIDWGTGKTSEVLPENMAGIDQPMIFTGKCNGELPGEIQVRAMVGGKACVWTARPRPINSNSSGAIEAIWAKMKITALADRYLETSDKTLVEQMKQTALEHSVVSPVTSLLMVDALREKEKVESRE